MHSVALPSAAQLPLLLCCLRLRGEAAQTVSTRYSQTEHTAAAASRAEPSESQGGERVRPLWRARGAVHELFALAKSDALDADGAALVRRTLRERRGGSGERAQRFPRQRLTRATSVTAS